MIKLVSVDNMRKSDTYTIENEVPSLELMRRAGQGVFSALSNWTGPVAIACGTGNNAGDGYVLASLLNKAGIKVNLILAKEQFSSDGKYYFDICKSLNIPYEIYSKAVDFGSYATIVDCLFGTGFKGAPRAPYDEIINKINNSKAYVVSVDINSGLNGDSGMGETFVISDLTVSIGDYKTGHFLNMAKDAMKSRTNIDIGIKIIDSAYQLLEADDLKECFKPRKHFSNKSDYGYTALIGGCDLYSGAIRLAGLANIAMRSGAGVVTVALPKGLSAMAAEQLLEATVLPLSQVDGHIKFVKEEFDQLIKRYRVIAIGMGIGNNEETIKCIEYLLENFCGSLLIDADGLSALSLIDKKRITKSCAKLVLTPHLKEFSRLSKVEIEAIYDSYVELAKATAREYKAIILLKGPTSLITDGDNVYFTDTGCPGMATAGSGDVLSGIIAALLGYNIGNELMATAAGAYINGLAGLKAAKEHGNICMIASDTIKALSACIL